MNKQDIYYTPGIEEFYDGFEYEEQEFFTDASYINNNEELIITTRRVYDLSICTLPVQELWVPKIYKFGDLIYKTRVKYLDEEDLKECRFIIKDLPRRYFKGDYKLIDHGNTVISITHNINEQGLFFGDVKNLSELKKLLIQLGIQYENN